MKDRSILALKGLAIIGVVLHHISNRRFDPEVSALIRDSVFAFSWCVLGFFCVSGYLQALSDSRKTKSIAEFTRARVNRLLVPFVILVFVYCALWQLVQAMHVPNLGTTVPPDFLGKLKQGLWPTDSRVAQQLYFFPLLFGISVVLVVVQKLLGIRGMWAAALIGFVAGAAFFPGASTGFSLHVFLWGVGFYAAGYLLFYYRGKRLGIRVILLVTTILLALCEGCNGLLLCVPLWLISEGPTLRLDRVPLLAWLGEASGTIYIYHTPFIIIPLMIGATFLHGPIEQFTGVLLGAAAAIGICCGIHYGLRNTRAKVLLM